MKPLVPAPGGVPLAFARTPFGRDVHRDNLPFGLTVAEILQTIPELPDRAWTHGIVCLHYVIDCEAHSQPVPREWWPLVRLSERPVPVTMTLHVPFGTGGGGGGGRKSVIALVASIALIAATTAISAGTLGPAGLAIAGGYFAAGSTSAALLSAGIGIIGGLAIAALTAPPSLDRSNSDSRELGSASASGNQLSPSGVIPRAIGEFRASPSFAAQPLVEIVGDDEIVEAVYAMSGPHQWNDIRIDDVPAANDEAYTLQTREGWNSDTAITLVTRQGFTEVPNATLSEYQLDKEKTLSLKDQATPANSVPKWQTYITRRSPDEAWLHLLFPEGLLFLESPDHYVGVPVRFRMRPRGTTTWINLPEIHFNGRGSPSFKKAVKFMWQAAPGGALPTPKTAFAPIYAYKYVPTQSIDPIGSGGWSSNPYFASGAGDDLYSADTVATTKVINVGLFEDRVEFYLGAPLDPTGTFSHLASGVTTGTFWEIQVLRGQPYLADHLSRPEDYNYELGGVDTIVDFFGYVIKAGKKEVTEFWQGTQKKILLMRVVSVWNEHPIGGKGLALLAVTAKNRSLQNVSALLRGYVQDWNGSAWATWVTTSNPAPHFRYILTGAVNAYPLPTALIDDPGLVDWRTRCIADNLHCNMIADGRNADELLNVVAGCGYAKPRESELWGVVQDRDRSGEAPVQIFTPRNMAGFRFEKAFPVLPHGLRPRYRDQGLDFKEANELTVYDAGYNADGSGGLIAAERLEEVVYDGLTTQSAASARAAFDLAQARLRSTFYYGSVDAEALVATKGDLVGVQHDILTSQAGFARVKAKHVSGGFVTGLLLDSKIPTGTTGIAIRLKDGSGLVIAEELSNAAGYVDEVTFTTPFADPGSGLGEGALIASGTLGSEYLRLLLFDIQPGGNLTASVTFVDEAPGLWPIVGSDDASFDSSFDASFL